MSDAQKFRLTRDEGGNYVVSGVEIFRAGDYGKNRVWTPDMVAALAANYDRSWIEAPVTPDHVQSGPAWGWIKSACAENGVLYADLQLHEFAVALVARGFYRNRSVEVYTKHRLKDGSEGPYLKAVSLLGAAQPAVSGMAPMDLSVPDSEQADFAVFSIESDQVSEAFALPDYHTQEGTKMPDTPNPAPDPAGVDPVAFASLQANYDQLAAELARVKVEAFREKQAAKFDRFAAEQVNEGKPFPAIENDAREFFNALPHDEAIRDQFLALLSKIPAVVSVSGNRQTTPVARVSAVAGKSWGDRAVQDRAVERLDQFMRENPEAKDTEIDQFHASLRREFEQKGAI